MKKTTPKHGEMVTIHLVNGETYKARYTTYYFPPDGAYVIDNSSVKRVEEVDRWETVTPKILYAGKCSLELANEIRQKLNALRLTEGVDYNIGEHSTGCEMVTIMNKKGVIQPVLDRTIALEY